MKDEELTPRKFDEIYENELKDYPPEEAFKRTVEYCQIEFGWSCYKIFHAYKKSKDEREVKYKLTDAEIERLEEILTDLEDFLDEKININGFDFWIAGSDFEILKEYHLNEERIVPRISAKLIIGTEIYADGKSRGGEPKQPE